MRVLVLKIYHRQCRVDRYQVALSPNVCIDTHSHGRYLFAIWAICLATTAGGFAYH